MTPAKTSFLHAIRAVANGDPISRNASDDTVMTVGVSQQCHGDFTAGVDSGLVASSIGWLHGFWQSNGEADIFPAVLYQLAIHGASMESVGYDDQKGAGPLSSDGSGVPSLVEYILRTDRDRYDRLSGAMREHIPGLRELEIRTPAPDRRRLDLVLENGFRLPADQASAGVRLILFFIALAHHPSPPRMVLIEEPENGIHPKLDSVMWSGS